MIQCYNIYYDTHYRKKIRNFMLRVSFVTTLKTGGNFI